MAKPIRLLIVGGGGREHALASRIRRDAPGAVIFAAPGNPGIAELGTCVDVQATDVESLLALAQQHAIDLTIVGPEAALAAGIVDRFRTAGLAIFGPTAAAAEIETSKAFAKSLMREAKVPTGEATICTSVEEARDAIIKAELTRNRAPIVIKASGLAAGKGVIICHTIDEADDAVRAMLEQGAFGRAGETVLVEEFMEGEELSVFVITDGTRAIPLTAAQDHKRLLDGDRGPNTGGMGAYAPVSVAGDSPDGSMLMESIMNIVIHPTLEAMRKQGRPFTGLLYCGLMLTDTGPRVVEFNCRFGDPETEAILPILEAEPTLLELMRIVASGEQLPSAVSIRASQFAVTTVVAAAGYPDQVRKGDAIHLRPAGDGVIVFHAGTMRDSAGVLRTAGGRVLAVTGLGESIGEAARRSAAAADAVQFEGKQFRRDIGWRELERASLS